MSRKSSAIVPDEVVMRKIYLIRGMKVMLDRDLAELYGVATKRLKEQVRRNPDRFPEDFMFEMTKEELENWRSQFATSSREIMGLRRPPFVFTEHGVLMLSSVLNSARAIQMNIRIMRIFTKMKEIILTHKDLLLKIEQIERKMSSHDRSLVVLFEHLKKLLEEKLDRDKQMSRKRIGFKQYRV
jgi:hypothetical protein